MKIISREVYSKMQHTTQATGAWFELSFWEQMANIGSEVHRAISWKNHNNLEYSRSAFLRSLELIDLTLKDKLTAGQLKELCRTREAWCDFMFFDNEYHSTAEQWQKYFDQFLMAHRLKQMRSSSISQ